MKTLMVIRDEAEREIRDGLLFDSKIKHDQIDWLKNFVYGFYGKLIDGKYENNELPRVDWHNVFITICADRFESVEQDGYKTFNCKAADKRFIGHGELLSYIARVDDIELIIKYDAADRTGDFTY